MNILEKLSHRAEVSRKIRADRDDLHSITKIDFPTITYSTKDLAGAFGFKSERQFRDLLNDINKSGEYNFEKLPNNHHALQPKDVYWLAEKLNVPGFKREKRLGFVLNLMQLKGGCGKTLSADMLSDGFTLSPQMIVKNLRVLIIDLDPQGSLTKQKLGNFKTSGSFFSATTFMSMPTDEISKSDIISLGIQKTDNANLDVFPCTTEDGFLSPVIAAMGEKNGMKPHELLLKNVIEFIRDDYDIIMIDAGPHLDDIFIAALGASDGLLSPVPPKEVDFDSTLKFLERIPGLVNEMIDDGYDANRLLFSKAFCNMWSENPRAEVDLNMMQRCLEELEDVFGESDLIAYGLSSDPVYQRCSDAQRTVFSLNSSMYSKLLGDSRSFTTAKKSATKWMHCVWKAIRFASKTKEL